MTPSPRSTSKRTMIAVSNAARNQGSGQKPNIVFSYVWPVLPVTKKFQGWSMWRVLVWMCGLNKKYKLWSLEGIGNLKNFCEGMNSRFLILRSFSEPMQLNTIADLYHLLNKDHQPVIGDVSSPIAQPRRGKKAFPPGNTFHKNDKWWNDAWSKVEIELGRKTN